MKRALTVLLTITVVCGAIGGTWLWYQNATAAPAENPVPTAPVTRGLLRSVIHSTGPVVTRQDIPIKCKASGTVIQLPFDVSDRVKKGDILLQLDTDDQDRAVSKARAALNASLAQLEHARQELVVARLALKAGEMKAEATLLAARARQKDLVAKLNRTEKLFSEKLVSQEEFDTATTLVVAADAEVKSAEAQQEQLKSQAAELHLKEQQIKLQQANVDQNQVNLDVQLQQLAYATVRSPIDGVVANLISGRDAALNDIITRIGSVVQSGTANVSGGTTVMTISDHSRMFVYANVAESDIGRVVDPQHNPGAPAQRVRITADSYLDQVFTGRVVRVADQGVMNQNVVVFEVRIEVESANKDLLKPRMTANVEIIVAEKTDALLLPLAAFGRANPATRPSGAASKNAGTPGRVNVVLADGTIQPREITVGIADSDNYEILAGLAEGDRVVLNAGMDSKWQRAPLPGSGAPR